MPVRVGPRMRAALAFIAEHPGTSLMAAAKAAHPARPERGRISVLACIQGGMVADSRELLAGPRCLYLTTHGRRVMQ
jgi:hypothetical protein